MSDYTYPSIFLAYLMFFLFVGGAIFFLVRSRHDGYWGNKSEEPKYRMLTDDENGRDADRKTNQRETTYGGNRCCQETRQ